ncbi:Myb-related protein Myb4 [Dendrobium catenatum]|uniref:Myb-related protein Myb4 n=1 Tax=Dendrobium catenatum TaxID=906689 RepID=A0A2I0X744_9ASPA|nr:Myb-related protein Myb4 [Dendrobium catenatum]
MGRSPYWDDSDLKNSPWTLEEDHKLVHYIQKHGHCSWRALSKLVGIVFFLIFSL